MAQLGQGAGLNLAYALARDAKLPSHLFQWEGMAGISQTEAQLQHQSLSGSQDVLEDVLNFLLHGAGSSRLFRGGAGLVGEHVTQLLLLIFADWKLQ